MMTVIIYQKNVKSFICRNIAFNTRLVLHLYTEISCSVLLMSYILYNRVRPQERLQNQCKHVQPSAHHVIAIFRHPNNIAHTSEVMSGSTGTNADEIQIAGRGVKMGLLSIPLRNMHTAAEIIDLNDVEATAELMAEYILERGRSDA